jgi:hypothetical protein
VTRYCPGCSATVHDEEHHQHLDRGLLPEIGPQGSIHVWLPAEGTGTPCGLPSRPGMVGTARSLHLVTCKDCERILAERNP